jgi:peptide/nickel transport system permease protein
MGNYLARRLMQIIPLVIGITFVAFLLINLAPGDPVTTLFPPQMIKGIDIEVIREQLGLNDPLPVQYVKMMWKFVNGDLNSFIEKRPTTTMILERLPTTITFAFLALFFSLLVGIPVAILSATRSYSFIDDIAMVGSMVGLSLPSFWFALILILIFSEKLRFLPPSGIRPLQATGYNLGEMFPYLILPTLVLSMGILPSIVRYARSSMMEVMRQDYIQTARAKGLKERAVVYGHALKNALIPVVSLIGILFPMLIEGSVIVETIFALPGLGRLAMQSALNRDYPLILSINMMMAFVVLASNLMADISYAFLDPRIRLGE